eukprot:934758-Amphidinium_carterae.1
MGIVHVSHASSVPKWLREGPTSRWVPNAHSWGDAFMPCAHEDLQTLKARRKPCSRLTALILTA